MFDLEFCKTTVGDQIPWEKPTGPVELYHFALTAFDRPAEIDLAASASPEAGRIRHVVGGFQMTADREALVHTIMKARTRQVDGFVYATTLDDFSGWVDAAASFEPPVFDRLVTRLQQEDKLEGNRLERMRASYLENKDTKGHYLRDGYRIYPIYSWLVLALGSVRTDRIFSEVGIKGVVLQGGRSYHFTDPATVPPLRRTQTGPRLWVKRFTDAVKDPVPFEPLPRTFEELLTPFNLAEAKPLTHDERVKLCTHPETGQKIIVKTTSIPEACREEYWANRIYEALDVPVPKAVMLEGGDQPTMVMSFVAGPSVEDYITEVQRRTGGVREESAAEMYRVRRLVDADAPVDALLGHYDATLYHDGNILVQAETGIPYRIDFGGALRLQYNGQPKILSDQSVDYATSSRDRLFPWGTGIDDFAKLRHLYKFERVGTVGFLSNGEIVARLERVQTAFPKVRALTAEGLPQEVVDTLEKRLHNALDHFRALEATKVKPAPAAVAKPLKQDKSYA